ncbi:MAG: type I restriction-modification system subunit M N-terminal domain-containing protein [Rhodoluna sp.]
MADQNLSSFLWSVADLLRGDYKRSDFGKVILPFTVLRRLDCVLEATKAAEKEKSSPRLSPYPPDQKQVEAKAGRISFAHVLFIWAFGDPGSAMAS